MIFNCRILYYYLGRLIRYETKVPIVPADSKPIYLIPIQNLSLLQEDNQTLTACKHEQVLPKAKGVRSGAAH